MKHPTLIAVDLILSAIQDNVGDDGASHSFLFGKPGAPHWQKNLRADIFVSNRQLIKAASFIRQNGAPHLKSLSISDITRQISDFIVNFFWFIYEDTILKSTLGTYEKHVSDKNKNELSRALLETDLFLPKNKLTLYPLATVEVQDPFSSKHFFLQNTSSLDQEFDPLSRKSLAPNQFPPDVGWKYRTETPLSWLGVFSPVQPYSDKYKAQILASLSLTQPHRYRHRFSGRKVFGGFATISDGMNIQFGTPNTPAISENIIVTKDDHEWLHILASKMSAPNNDDKRHLRALEYYYRAWPLAPSERFPWLCMTLDALFGDVSHATRAVVDGVQSVLGERVSARRLGDLMKLRASTIHGGAPDVYDSRKYGRYYRKYAEDPIFDLGLIVEACLRERLFMGALTEHPDPHEKLIEQMIAEGRVPRARHKHSILGQDEHQ